MSEWDPLAVQARFNNTMSELAACAETAESVVAEETAVELRNPQFFQERMEGLAAMLCLPDGGSAIKLIRCVLANPLLPLHRNTRKLP